MILEETTGGAGEHTGERAAPLEPGPADQRASLVREQGRFWLSMRMITLAALVGTVLKRFSDVVRRANKKEN